VLRLFGNRRRPDRQGRLTGIYVCARADAPMQSLESVEAETDRGLQGDRYASKTGFWKRTDACQVTMIAEEDLSRIEARTGVALHEGQHRRNLVLRGLSAADLAGRHFRVGEVVFVFERPRPPCGHLESLTQPGMAKALGRHAGLCARVLEGGRLTVGDDVVLL
jgi:MOSC domain-containing protein YiiM